MDSLSWNYPSLANEALKDEGHYRIDGEILKNELQKWNQHPRKPRAPVISSF